MLYLNNSVLRFSIRRRFTFYGRAKAPNPVHVLPLMALARSPNPHGTAIVRRR